MRVETELCAYSAEAVRVAAEFGLTRVELCAEPELEGTSPDEGVLREVLAVRGACKVNVMVRPRGGDFVYSDEEFGQMRRQVERARELGADGVVSGILTANGDVDVDRMHELVERARPLGCTFHRAFDVARDWRAALGDVIGCGCTRLLTSGQAVSAIEGVETLREIVAAAEKRIEVMAGAGVDPANAAELIKAGVDALHFSARRDGRFADPEFIKEMKEQI